jgi:hypothetical protein
MITPMQYVETYLRLYVKLGETVAPVSVRNYLKSGTGHQSQRALAARAKLIAGLLKLLKPKGGILPHVFEVQGKTCVRESLYRVYIGKGAPDEIQTALWLASLCNLVSVSTKDSYTDQNLGLDCGGFVANYLGEGRPSPTELKPYGSTGILPRNIWVKNKSMHRDHPSRIQTGDVAVFFRNFKGDDLACRGCEAFHIGLVSRCHWSESDNTIDLEIADSRGSPSQFGGDGVNIRSLDHAKSNVSNKLAYCVAGNNRIYFTDAPTRAPYMPEKVEAGSPEDTIG